MWKIITILALSVLLSGCITTGREATNLDDSRFIVPYTPGQQQQQSASMLEHSIDTAGQNAFPSSRHTSGRKTFVFSPRAHAWAVYDQSGQRVKTGRASGGQKYCADVGRGCKTVVGHYRVYSKRGVDCVSKKFPIGKGGASMPNCMFFHGGYAIHGSYQVPDYNASHGCIRVLPSAANWLNNNFMDIGTSVVVESY